MGVNPRSCASRVDDAAARRLAGAEVGEAPSPKGMKQNKRDVDAFIDLRHVLV